MRRFLTALALTIVLAGTLAACDDRDQASDAGAGPPPPGGEAAAPDPLRGPYSSFPRDSGHAGLPTLAPIVEAVAPSVVNIATTGTVTQRLNPLFQDPFFRRFFDMPDGVEQRTQSIGSGVIIDADDGYIVTNHHVIRNADTIIVTLKDRREVEAELIGTDPATDVAVLKIDADDLTQIPQGNSDDVRVGDFVIAIGNPFGLGQTVTTGIVSAVGRSRVGIDELEDFIQTDAAINPGNSGGALVDLFGNLVGINTAIVGPNGGNVGIGFAIPVNIVRERMRLLIEHGEVQRGLLGVEIQDVTPAIAEALGLDDAWGALVVDVQHDSAAEKAKIRPGDVILAADGRRIRDSATLRNVVGLTPPGTGMELEVLRRGRRETVEVVIGGAE